MCVCVCVCTVSLVFIVEMFFARDTEMLGVFFFAGQLKGHHVCVCVCVCVCLCVCLVLY